MNGATTLQALERIHRRRGTLMTLHREGVSPDVDVWAKVFSASGQELVGSADEVGRRIRITNAAIGAAGWPGPPRKGDTIGNYVIELSDTRSIGDVVVTHILDVAKVG